MLFDINEIGSPYFLCHGTKFAPFLKVLSTSLREDQVRLICIQMYIKNCEVLHHDKTVHIGMKNPSILKYGLKKSIYDTQIPKIRI